MFNKTGDSHPITIIDNLTDVDDKNTRKIFKKTLKNVKGLQKTEIPAQVKESEKK